MKILFINPRKFKTAQTGDATQSKQTSKAIQQLGHHVTHIYTETNPIRFFSAEYVTLDLAEVQRIADNHDIVHFIPASVLMIRFWKKNIPTITPIAVSTIFWAGWTRLLLAWHTQVGISKKLSAMTAFLLQMCPILMDYRGVQLFLPNSSEEVKCVKRFWRHSKQSHFIPVPNAWIPPDFDIHALPRPKSVPSEDYIVVPAVFAPRKNQLGLIKALRKSHYPIVFMGGTVDPAYYAECKKYATPNMSFIDFKSSAEPDYWAVLAHSRCACLPADCETPGIALLEASYAGARPIITEHGGTKEYYGDYAEYLNPLSKNSILHAVETAWKRNRLSLEDSESFKRFSWTHCAQLTLNAYAPFQHENHS